MIHAIRQVWSEARWVQVVVGTAILYTSAQICIPLHPVPVTLQPTAVMLLGLCFSRTSAIQSVMTYLLLGALGAPVFAMHQGGFPILMGPRGGYLLGFLPAAALMTTLRPWLQAHLGWWAEFMATMIGTACIYAFGLIWLSFIVGGFGTAVQVGLIPFIIPGLVKNTALAACVRYIRGNIQ